MAHVAIFGITDTGKTTLAKRLANEIYKPANIPRLILDPDKNSGWNVIEGEDFITDDPEKFLEVCQTNTSCAIFVDESGLTIGRYSGPMQWLATNSRKFGHRAHFISQRATQIDPLVRTQCSSLFLFQQSVKDSKLLADDFCRTELIEASGLLKGEYLYKIGVDGQVKRGKAW